MDRPCEPVAAVLKARISAHHEKWQPGNAESMFLTKITPEAVVGNAISVIAAALLPGAVIGIPTVGAMLLHGALLGAVLFRRALRPVVAIAPLLLGMLRLLRALV